MLYIKIFNVFVTSKEEWCGSWLSVECRIIIRLMLLFPLRAHNQFIHALIPLDREEWVKTINIDAEQEPFLSNYL